MKLKLSFLASVAVVMVLALVGVLNDVSTTRAGAGTMPLPIQPFAADAKGGISTNMLGQSIASNWTVTAALQGERTTLPWIFSGPGFSLDLDKEIKNPVDDDGDTVINDGCPAVGNAEGALPALAYQCTNAVDEPDGDAVLDAVVNDGCPAVGPKAEGPAGGFPLSQCQGDYTNVGTVWTNVDAGCDGVVDYMANDCSALVGQDPLIAGRASPLIWREATTAVESDPDQVFLKSIMPPFSWLLRHQVPIDHLCTGLGPGGVPTKSVLNTIYAVIPYSPNGSTFVAQTKLGGSPDSPPSPVCLDSPQSSESVTKVYNNPPNEGDIDGVCNRATQTCADAGIYGMWTDNTVTIASGGDTQIEVEKHKVNNGPEDGDFEELWETESTNANITAKWDANNLTVFSQNLVLPVSEDTEQLMGLNLACTVTGDYWGLVVIKNLLSPIPPTEDTFLEDNAFTFVVLVKCGTPTLTPEVDKEVALIRAMPSHVAIPTEGTVPVFIDELKVNHTTTELLGDEWLVAEVGDVVPPFDPDPAGPDLILQWATGVTMTAEGHATVPITGSYCGSDACLKLTNVPEWPGQADVNAQLNITCRASTPAGLYPVVVKAIDLPKAGFESKASDNAQRKVITVRCGGAATDGIVDGNGLYARWTILQSQGSSSIARASDLRKDYQSPPSIVSDTGYVERIIDLQCFWIDDDGGAPADSDGVISEVASWQDPDLLIDGKVNDGCPMVGSWKDCDTNHDGDCLDTGEAALCSNAIDDDVPTDGVVNDGCPQVGAIPETGDQCTNDDDDDVDGIDAVDADRDCLMNAAFAQPGHPVDLPTISGTCSQLQYSENPIAVTYSRAKDADCDGLVDGIEKAWGSNPLLVDSDGDLAPDFVEMFQFTNPVNPDTDGDGLLDKPENNYLAAAVGVGDPSGKETGTQCTSDVDDDNDGAVNDGCPKVGDRVDCDLNKDLDCTDDGETGLCANNTDDDTLDTAETTAGRKVNDGCPAVTVEIVNLDDNCPSVYNPTQLNTDGQRRPNGMISGDYASNPSGDKLGDACDDDNDNDGAVNGYETTTLSGTKATSDPLKLDTDCDTVVDGPEWRYSKNLNDVWPACHLAIPPTCDMPVWSNSVDQTYYRGCNISVNGAYSAWDPEYDPLENNREMDPDGDTSICPGDTDSDNGGLGHAAWVGETPDRVEGFGYGIVIVSPDTDGDGCYDWVEIGDINGDRSADSGDQGQMNRRIAGKIASDCVSCANCVADRVFDLNKDGDVDSGDQGVMNRNTCTRKGDWGGCPTCPPEN